MAKPEEKQYKEMGQYLRDCREGLGFKIEDISEQLNIRERYLSAIENGDFDCLPGNVYTEGYLKNYAECLQLDPNEIVKRYRQGGSANDDNDPDEEFLMPEPYSDKQRPTGKIIALSVFAVLAAYLGWYYLQDMSFSTKVATEEREPLQMKAMSQDELDVLSIRQGKLNIDQVQNLDALNSMDSDSQYSILSGASDANLKANLEEIKTLSENKKLTGPDKNEVLEWKLSPSSGSDSQGSKTIDE